MTIATKAAAKRFYQRATPLHGRSAAHKADVAAIEAAPQPMAHAEKLVAQRNDEITESRIEEMLRDQQGRRKRYAYNQSAVIGLEHLVDGPMDPTTQVPIWRQMLAATRGTTMPKDAFMKGARAILSQTNLYDPATMAA